MALGRVLSTLKRRASRSDERGQPAWVTLADSAKIGPRDIIPPIRRGGDLKAAQRSRVGIASSFISVGRTRLFTLSSNANSVTLCVQSSVPVRTARAG